MLKRPLDPAAMSQMEVANEELVEWEGDEPNSFMPRTEEPEVVDGLVDAFSCTEAWEQSEGEEEDPGLDLHEYFNQYAVPMVDRVTLCRSYANYVAKTTGKK